MILLDQFCILKCIGWQQQNKIVYTATFANFSKSIKLIEKDNPLWEDLWLKIQ
jgi:pterin-4a-carbinolamine dehydratase